MWLFLSLAMLGVYVSSYASDSCIVCVFIVACLQDGDLTAMLQPMYLDAKQRSTHSSFRRHRKQCTRASKARVDRCIVISGGNTLVVAFVLHFCSYAKWDMCVCVHCYASLYVWMCTCMCFSFVWFCILFVQQCMLASTVCCIAYSPMCMRGEELHAVKVLG